MTASTGRMRVRRRAREEARDSPRRAIHAVMMKSVTAFMTAKRIAAKRRSRTAGAQPLAGNARVRPAARSEAAPVVEAAMALLAAARGDATESAGRTVRPQGRSQQRDATPAIIAAGK